MLFGPSDWKLRKGKVRNLDVVFRQGIIFIFFVFELTSSYLVQIL